MPVPYFKLICFLELPLSQFWLLKFAGRYLGCVRRLQQVPVQVESKSENSDIFPNIPKVKVAKATDEPQGTRMSCQI